DQFHRLQEQLGEIMARLPARKEADLAATIREISARQRVIEERGDTAAMRRDQKAIGDAVGALHDEVVALNARVAAIAQDSAGEDSAILALARRSDALAAERPPDGTLLHGIRADLDQLRAVVAPLRSGSSTTDLGDRYAALAEQVNAALAKLPDSARIDALSDEVSALRRAI